MSFQRALDVGRVAEGLIAAWLQSRGNSIMPAYEIEKSVGKGPQLFCADGEFVSPDMMAFTRNGIIWVEAKHKTRFTWHRASRQWTTGIDLRHYGEYLEVEKRTRLPVWLMFYHRESTPNASDVSHGCPPECPVGLYGGKLLDLVVAENHRSPHYDPARAGIAGHGRSGMVYWAPSALVRLATKEQVIEAASMVSKARESA